MTMDVDVVAEQQRRAASAYSGGSLTEAGKKLVKEWVYRALIRDDGASMSPFEACEAFQANEEHGFAIDCQDFETALNELYGFRRSDPKDPIHARFRDDLGGVEAFDPADDDPTNESSVAARRDIVEGLIPVDSVNAFVALPEALKSWAAFSLAVAVSKGEPWLGKYPTREGRSAIIDFEVGTMEIRKRLRILGADGRVLHKSYPRRNLNDPLFWSELPKLQVRFFVIDSLVAGSGVEYSSTDSRFAAPLRYAAEYVERQREENEGSVDHFVGFVFILHSPKSAKVKDVEGLFYGGTLRGAVDSAYYFDRLPAPDGESRARVTNIKVRKGTPPDPFAIRLTGAGGVELFTEEKKQARKAETLTDADRVHAAIVAAPDGVSATVLSADLGIRKENVLMYVRQLKEAGVVTGVGAGRNARLVTVPETQIRSESDRIDSELAAQ